MASNFDFLKNIDEELYGIIEDAQKLFRDEYFNQCVVQLRIFAEKMAKKILGSQSKELTFDDTLNCLKDKIKTDREKEFVDDLFFIKKEGNKCAHGEDSSAITALETIRCAFEASINYAYSIKKDEKINKLQFDETMLITLKPQKEVKLVDKYIELANQQKEELLNSKQGEFINSIEKSEEGFKDKNKLSNPKQYKTKKKPLTPTQQKVKTKVKEAKKNLKQNINKTPKKPTKKQEKLKKQQKDKIKKAIFFFIIVTISLFFLTKMIFCY